MKNKKFIIKLGLLLPIILLSGFILLGRNLVMPEKYYDEIKSLKSSNGEISIDTPENETYSAPMSGYYPATYGFENDEAGSDPAEWTVYEGAGYVNVNNETNNHKRVVEMYDNNNANHDELHGSFSLQTYGTVEYWMMSSDVTLANQFTLLDDHATGVYGTGIGWLILDEDKIRYEDNTGWHDTTKTVYDNTWYHIKVEFECTTGNYHGLAQYTWKFYVDGEEFGAFPFKNTIDNVSQAYFFTRGGDLNYRCYVDAVGYSWDPNYNTGDNLDEGLLLSFDKTFTPDWLGYSLDGLTNKTILGNKTLPMPAEGPHNIQVFGNDSMGDNSESTIRYFSIDINPPIISIIKPSLNEFYSNDAPDFDISITELNLNSTWYTLDSGNTNITFTGLTGTIDQTEWDDQLDGLVIIRFYANDSFGRISYTEVTVNKDTIIPVIIINAPSIGESFTTIPPSYNITVTESNLNSVWYTLDGGLTNITINQLTGYIDSTAWNNAPYGAVTIGFYAKDDAGNIVYAQVIVTKNTPQEPTPGIPGYNLILLIGASCMIIIFISAKIFKIKN